MVQRTYPSERVTRGITSWGNVRPATAAAPGGTDNEGTVFVSLQKTLRNKIQCTGVGLHSGAHVRMIMRPANSGTGVVFRRTDVDPELGIIPARYDLVAETMLGTTLTNAQGISIATVEHVMAALVGAGVDNVIIEINGPEVPIMDGSSAPFSFLIDCAGVVDLGETQRFLRVLRPVRVEDGDKWAELLPCESFCVDIDIEFDTAAIRRQSYSFELTERSFRTELSRARTFGFLRDVDRLRAMGLAQGGSLENSIVIDGDRVLNAGGLRFEDEFVRHKALDAVGDLALAGSPLLARYRAFKAGHGLNNAILRALFADADAWCWSIGRPAPVLRGHVAMPDMAAAGAA